MSPVSDPLTDRRGRPFRRAQVPRRPAKNPEKQLTKQLDLPAPPPTLRVLPTRLRVGTIWPIDGPLHNSQRQERARSCSASRPAWCHRHPNLGRARARQRETSMSLTDWSTLMTLAAAIVAAYFA